MRNRKTSGKTMNPFIAFLWDNLTFAVTFGLCIIALLAALVIHPVVIVGNSMYPTLKDGEIYKTETKFTADELARGDIIVARHEKRYIIKRLIGMPGETVWIKDGIVYIDGEKEPFAFDRIENAGLLGSPVTLGADEYIVLGDNRNASGDSRKFGVVHYADISRVVTGGLL